MCNFTLKKTLLNVHTMIYIMYFIYAHHKYVRPDTHIMIKTSKSFLRGRQKQ